MLGGGGSDIYLVDSSFDRVIENANEGTDAVYTSVSYQLGANVEYLSDGTANINGFGNARIITSKETREQCHRWRRGLRYHAWRSGTDIYFVDSSFDQVIENANEGIDAVYSSTVTTCWAQCRIFLPQRVCNLNGFGNSLSTTFRAIAETMASTAGAERRPAGGGGNDTFIFRAGEPTATCHDFDGAI